jgi:Ca2+/H+ antiporter, TMEM165/GDT1 family
MAATRRTKASSPDKPDEESDPAAFKAKTDMKQQLSAMAVMMTAFTMSFVAEWGDRSQIATIAMGTAKDPMGVAIGGVVAHALCTGVAVIGGKLLATKISEKVVLLVGGALFLVFAAHSIWEGPNL